MGGLTDGQDLWRCVVASKKRGERAFKTKTNEDERSLPKAVRKRRKETIATAPPTLPWLRQKDNAKKGKKNNVNDAEKPSNLTMMRVLL